MLSKHMKMMRSALDALENKERQIDMIYDELSELRFKLFENNFVVTQSMIVDILKIMEE